MSNYVVEGRRITNIADAIREKISTSKTYTIDEMPDAIRSISGGSSDFEPQIEMNVSDSPGTPNIKMYFPNNEIPENFFNNKKDYAYIAIVKDINLLSSCFEESDVYTVDIKRTANKVTFANCFTNSNLYTIISDCNELEFKSGAFFESGLYNLTFGTNSHSVVFRNGSFEGVYSLYDIDFSNIQILTIGDYAFHNSSIETITLNDSDGWTLGDGAFAESSLSEVTIGNDTFSNIFELKEWLLDNPERQSQIPNVDSCFYGCPFGDEDA